jgi:hypothetical protein
LQQIKKKTYEETILITAFSRLIDFGDGTGKI